MLIHHFHERTGVHHASAEAQPDPAEWDLLKQAAMDAILKPAHEAANVQLARIQDAYDDEMAAAGNGPEGEARRIAASRAGREARAAVVESLKEPMAAAVAAAAAVEPQIFLLPAHATFEAPPEPGEGEVAVHDGQGWSLQPAPPEVEDDGGRKAAFDAIAVPAYAAYDLAIRAAADTLEDDLAAIGNAPEGADRRVAVTRAARASREHALEQLNVALHEANEAALAVDGPDPLLVQVGSPAEEEGA